ncbi:MAG: hypothetical protein ABW068_14415 [Candidatus Thiodiazotropha sp.]
MVRSIKAGIGAFLMLMSLVAGADNALSLAQLHNDEQVVLIQRQALRDIIDFMERREDLFPRETAKTPHLLSREEKEIVWSTWIAFLDHLMILDAIEQNYEELPNGSDDDLARQAFHLAHAVFLTRYRFSLDFLVMTERDPLFHVILNEAVPELGLNDRTYAQLKYRYLHVAIATRFASLGVKAGQLGEAVNPKIQQSIEEDRSVIWEYGRGQGILQTLRNGTQIVKDAGFEAYFPVQKGVSDWMGDVKVLRAGHSLISPSQIEAMQAELQPGDILLERRE